MNIFVIEDEPPILRDILAIIKSFHEDYQVIGQASNGKDAIDFIKDQGNNIDVIISDIQIPVLNGLEVIDYTHKHFPHILSIILTGYSNFEYARKAIKCNVFDYLLKPIDENELQQQLQKAYTRKCLDYMKTPTHNSIPQENILEPQYQIAMLSLGSFPVYSSLYNELFPELWKKLKIEEYLDQSKIPDQQYWMIDGTSLAEKIILFHIPEKYISCSRQYLTDILSPLCKREPSITIAVDTGFSGIRDVHRSILNLKNFINKTSQIGISQLLFYPEMPANQTPEYSAAFLSYCNRLSKLMSQKNISVFEAELKNYIKQIQIQHIPALQVYRLISDLLNTCIRICDNTQVSDINIPSTITDIMILSDTYSALYENLHSIFLSLFEIILEDKDIGTDRNHAVIKIDAYMKEHYREPLNTKSIAEKFGFTPAYLSKIFREYKSITPADYIIQLRIEKAKELLSSASNCKIKDVAAFVGYDDSLYFSKVFKKITGISPRQYMEK